jgi:hypothetical protein
MSTYGKRHSAVFKVQVRLKHVWHACWTTGSCRRKGDTNKVRVSFTVFETVRYTKGKSLNLAWAAFQNS